MFEFIEILEIRCRVLDNRSKYIRAIRIHSLVQYETTTVVFDRSDCNDFIF